MSLDQKLEEQPPQSAASVEAAPAQPPPRGRPWLPGQSGNPRGRPTRARQAARVAEALIQRQTVPLSSKALELALAGDRMLLRDCLRYIAPQRREPPIDLDLPRIANRADLRVALAKIVDAVASGTLTAAQGKTLTQVLTEVWRYGRI